MVLVASALREFQPGPSVVFTNIEPGSEAFIAADHQLKMNEEDLVDQFLLQKHQEKKDQSTSPAQSPDKQPQSSINTNAGGPVLDATWSEFLLSETIRNQRHALLTAAVDAARLRKNERAHQARLEAYRRGAQGPLNQRHVHDGGSATTATAMTRTQPVCQIRKFTKYILSLERGGINPTSASEFSAIRLDYFSIRTGYYGRHLTNSKSSSAIPAALYFRSTAHSSSRFFLFFAQSAFVADFHLQTKFFGDLS